MSAARSLPILVSLLVSAGLWMLGSSLIPAENGAYGTLVCDEAVPDQEIRDRLEAQGFTGIVSESGQWVLIDSFGSVERVPLDEYAARILPFDPRYDGYAEKIRSLFVRDEKRFIYIALGPASLGPGFTKIENRLAAALEGIPFSFYAATGWPPVLFLALFCLAAVAFFLLRPLRVSLRIRAAWLLPLLPALAPLALAGAAGFALASLLAGCAVIFAGPWLEWRLALRSSARAEQTPPALCRLLPPIFLIFYGVIVFFSGLPPLFIVPVSVFFGILAVLQIHDAYHEAAGGNNTALWGVFFKRNTYRFSPVSIFSRRSFPFAFSWAMLPFAVVALALACAGLVVSAPGPAAASMLPPADTVTEADYYRHYWFQSTFSFRSLYAPEREMGVYELAPDGLLNESKKLTNETYGNGDLYDDAPPFPLDGVVQYLHTPGRGRGSIHTLLAALLPLLFVFPVLFRGGGVPNPALSYPLLHNQPYWGTLLKRLA